MRLSGDGYLQCKIMHAIHLVSNHIDISNTVLHLSIYATFVSGMLYCVCLYAHKFRLTNGLLGLLIGSVNCDVTGPL